MTIIAFGDIHGNFQNLVTLGDIIERADVAVFLGDGESALEVLPYSVNKKLFAVCGNTDMFSRLPTEMVIEVGGKKIFIAHGHTYSVKNTLDRITRAAKENEADIALFGHTHEWNQEERDGVTLVNVPPLGTSRTNDGNSYVKIQIVGGLVKIERCMLK